MDPLTAGLFAVFGVILFTLLGVRIAFAAGITGTLGLIAIRGWEPGSGLAGLLAYSESTHYTLSVLPMFILIGYLAFHAGLTQGAFYAARCWFGRLPGGLAIATVFAAAGFGAVSGASTASAAVFARVSIPEMLRYGYDKKLAAATVAAGGTLASLIPPSAILVIYGIIVEQSIGALLLAGFIPGFISAINYALIIIIWCKINPRLAGPAPDVDWAERFRSLKNTWGILAVIGIILGGLYTGWMTPTEVGGAGAFIMLVLALAHRTKWRDIWEAIRETSKLTVMIFTIIWSILILVRFLGFTGVPSTISEWIGDLEVPRLAILLMILGLYFVLGMFLDAIGMLLLTLPVVFPIIVNLGYDPIWFGIIVVKMVEIGLVTPPIGLNCFVVNGVRPDIPLTTVFAGIWPFVVADCATIALLIAYPEIVTFLPAQMSGAPG
ncbi:MAG: TRAP transporter large permease [Alphaproteobacteria bacterium]